MSNMVQNTKVESVMQEIIEDDEVHDLKIAEDALETDGAKTKDETTQPSGKRKRSGDSTDHTPKRSKQRNGVSPSILLHNKTSVAVLNELRQHLVYKLVSQDGPVHMPVFTMSVEVDGQVYEGQGRSKKLAKADAAEAALRSFIQFRDGNNAHQSPSQNNMDFTSDDFVASPSATSSPHTPSDNTMMRLAASMKEKGPVMLLNELYTNVKFICSSDSGTQFNKFKMTVTVNDESFQGTGPSKKLAKAAAAKSALSALCNLTYGQGISPGPVCAPLSPSDQKHETLSQGLADHIGKLVIEKFTTLLKNDPLHARRKVLAGIVLTRGSNLEDSEVISVSTGTKCVSGAHISARGLAINDSHAEIVSRRCLIDYLFAQLELHTDAATVQDSILVRDPTTKLFKVKEGIKFHLYINTAPCGDARIFSPHEEPVAGVDKHPNRQARGQLRTKIESGEGTIPVKNSSGIQTWDGVIQGDRLLTMSCSDKLCRWNVVGLQGALLSSVMDPIYLHSIVLGSLLHPGHMYRAICGRVEDNIQGLPPPYRLNKPMLALLTSSETRNPTKAPSFSVNWTTGMTDAEVVNSLNGKNLLGHSSRISKKAFYQRFVRLMPRLDSTLQVPDVYSDAKLMAIDYKTAKDMLLTAFKRSGLGEWLRKPIEQDQFELEDDK